MPPRRAEYNCRWLLFMTQIIAAIEHQCQTRQKVEGYISGQSKRVFFRRGAPILEMKLWLEAFLRGYSTTDCICFHSNCQQILPHATSPCTRLSAPWMRAKDASSLFTIFARMLVSGYVRRVINYPQTVSNKKMVMSFLQERSREMRARLQIMIILQARRHWDTLLRIFLPLCLQWKALRGALESELMSSPTSTTVAGAV